MCTRNDMELSLWLWICTDYTIREKCISMFSVFHVCCHRGVACRDYSVLILLLHLIRCLRWTNIQKSRCSSSFEVAIFHLCVTWNSVYGTHWASAKPFECHSLHYWPRFCWTTGIFGFLTTNRRDDVIFHFYSKWICVVAAMCPNQIPTA